MLLEHPPTILTISKCLLQELAKFLDALDLLRCVFELFKCFLGSRSEVISSTPGPVPTLAVFGEMVSIAERHTAYLPLPSPSPASHVSATG